MSRGGGEGLSPHSLPEPAPKINIRPGIKEKRWTDLGEQKFPVAIYLFGEVKGRALRE